MSVNRQNSPTHTAEDDGPASGDDPSANQDAATIKDPYDTLTEGGTIYAADNAEVLIHFREIPKDSISRDHVVSLMGPEKSKDNSAVEEHHLKIEKRKSDLRAWAREHVKKRLVGNARKLGFMIQERKGDVEVSTFAELKKWWRTRQRSDRKAVEDLGYVLFGWFEENPKWERALERKYMEDHKWAYTLQSLKEARENSKKEGADLKGCVALTMTYLKGEAVKQMQKVGKASKHGIVITKTRPTDKRYNEKGKYVKRKKGEYFLQVYEKPEKKIKVCSLCCGLT